MKLMAIRKKIDMAENDLANLYPHLFKETLWPWGPTRAGFIRVEQIPPIELIANINIVPRVGDAWAILRLADGEWDVPGGTLEPGESYMDAIQRELMEEAGAQLISHQLLGAWSCHSLADKPYRPHLPHPHFYRLVIMGEIRMMHPPENPLGGEIVSSVEIAMLRDIITRFASQDRHDLAELYQLASKIYQP